MSESGSLDAFLSELRAEFPSFRIIHKRRSRLSKSIDVALRMLTFGKQNRYLTHYHTVIGDTLYVPESWEREGDVDRIITLSHERVHLRQRRRFTIVGFALLYFLPFFPIGLAYGRARLEWEAYVATLRSTYRLKGRQAAHSEALREDIVRRFTGPDYLWMWPFPGSVRRWYREALRELDESDDPSPSHREAAGR